MNLFSRVFRNRRPKPEPFVVRWSRQRTTELKAKTEVTPEVMSAAFLNYLCTFGTPSDHKEVLAHFANDSTLFELGCFMLVHICGWLNTKHPKFAKPVGQCFDDEFFHVFTQALQIDTLGKLVDQRTLMYREFMRSGDNYAEKVDHHLNQLIWRTYDNQKPEPYDPAHYSMLLAGIFEAADVTIHVHSWMSGLLSMLEGFDSNSDLWNSLGRRVASQSGNPEVATALRPAIELHPDDPQAWYDLAVTCGRDCKHDDAVASFRQTIKLKPDYALAWYGLGLTYVIQGKHDDAIAAYRQTVKLKPDYALAWSALGQVYWFQGNHAAAAAAYREAIKLEPDDAQAWYGLGEYYKEQGKYDDAVTALRRAITLNPAHSEAWSELGLTYGDQSMYDDALTACLQAVRLKPDSCTAWGGLYTLYLRQGKRSEALDALNQIRKLEPSLADKLAGLLSPK
jgi:cytochrome c-type biogenesis protein CcmH/NrfG